MMAVCHDGTESTEEQLWRWCQDWLPHFAVPRYIEFRVAQMRNANGAVSTHQMHDDGIASTAWDIGESDIKMVQQ